VDPSKWVEWVKLSPRYLVAIALFTGVILFAPSGFASALGLASLPLPVRIALGIAFLGSIALLIANGGASLVVWGQAERENRRKLEVLQQRLQDLTPDEKAVLRVYIAGKTRTQSLDPQNGVVGSLTFEHIIYAATEVRPAFGYWAYNIQPWAWAYLNEHPELLEG
jgi:Super-infection exclusion protein B